MHTGRHPALPGLQPPGLVVSAGASPLVRLRGRGWARLTRLGGSGPPLDIALSAWNPGGPGQSIVPGTNYTYSVNGAAGQSVCGGFHAWWIDNQGNRRYIGWFDPGCYRA